MKPNIIIGMINEFTEKPKTTYGGYICPGGTSKEFIKAVKQQAKKNGEKVRVSSCTQHFWFYK